MVKYYLGIDTSAYTTSLAVLDYNCRILLDLRENLKVKHGERGLRQQDAIFQHIKNMPNLIERMTKEIDVCKIEVVSSSSKPRNKKDSYMPVFEVGKGQAFILSQILACKYKEFSHQEGHIASGILSNKKEFANRFLSLHISGGTTELLIVNKEKRNYEIDIIGGTLDLNIGQLVDRIGVEAGLKFPCGKEMDEISKEGNILKLPIPINIKNNTWFNVSGMENYFKQLIKSGSYKLEDIFLTLFHTIENFLYNIILNSSRKYQLNNILITGGVAANKTLRENLEKNLFKKNIQVYFSSIYLSTDNAVGIAYMGMD